MANKKAALPIEIGVWMVRIILIIMVIAGVGLQSRARINAQVNIDVVESDVISSILSDVSAFLYRDSTGTTHSIIDVQRFEQLTSPALTSLISFPTKHVTAKITVMNYDGSQERVRYYDKDYYDFLFGKSAVFLGRGVSRTTRQWPVVLVDNGKRTRGVLRIEVLQER